MKAFVHSDILPETRLLVERDRSSGVQIAGSLFTTRTGETLGVAIHGPYQVHVPGEGDYDVLVVAEERETDIATIPITSGGIKGLFNASKIALLLIRLIIRKHPEGLFDEEGEPVHEDWLPSELT
ncbi:hypothetical protein EON81_22775 [bacterium]|nr:MAG: hypothetical protein EON81_22775 [bacterium]